MKSNTGSGKGTARQDGYEAGKSCKSCSVLHASIVGVIEAGPGGVPEAAVLGACTDLSSRHPHEPRPA